MDLADYLVKNHVVIDFKLKNIGIDQNYQPKYFIGLDFEITSVIGQDLLLQKYKSQIDQILLPYLPTSTQNSKKFHSNVNKIYSHRHIHS